MRFRGARRAFPVDAGAMPCCAAWLARGLVFSRKSTRLAFGCSRRAQGVRQVRLECVKKDHHIVLINVAHQTLAENLAIQEPCGSAPKAESCKEACRRLRSTGTQLAQDCARPSLEERKSCRRRLKLLTGARAGVRPAGKGLATSRERVLRGAVATRPAKRRQRSLRPCD